MDPETWGDGGADAGGITPDTPSDAGAGGADDTTTGGGYEYAESLPAGTDAAAEDGRAQLVADRERERERERERTARRFAQALEGNEEAAAWLRQQRLGRYIERGEAAVSGRVSSRADVLAQGQRFVADLDALRDADPFAFAEKMRDPEVSERYAQWRAHLGMKAQPPVRVAATAAAAAEEAYADLRADADAALLTDDDWDDLDPDNFADLSPAKAVNAMNKAFRVAVAKAQAKTKTAPAEARRRSVARQADAVEAALAKAPPVAGGGSAPRQSFDAIRDAFLDNPTPANRTAYEKARQARGW